MGLKHWILHNNHFETHLFFQFLGGGTLFSSDPGLKGGPNLKGQGSDDLYHTEFVSWRVYHFSFFLFSAAMSSSRSDDVTQFVCSCVRAYPRSFL